MISPLSHLNELRVDINVVAPIRPVLDVGQAEDVKELVSSPDMVHTAPAFTHRGQHQHVSSRPLQVAWKYFKSGKYFNIRKYFTSIRKIF